MTLRLSLRRQIVQQLVRGFFALTTKLTIIGQEHLPDGAALLVANHPHHLDSPLLLAGLPVPPEMVALAEPKRRWVIPIIRFYEAIPVRRDEVDRSMLRAVLAALEEGKQILLFPEARISRTGVLQEARDGIGYLALKTGVPVVPLAITGTEHARATWQKGRRPQLTMTIAPPLILTPDLSQPRRLQRKIATTTIMKALAAHLPASYQGYYAELEGN